MRYPLPPSVQTQSTLSHDALLDEIDCVSEGESGMMDYSEIAETQEVRNTFQDVGVRETKDNTAGSESKI